MSNWKTALSFTCVASLASASLAGVLISDGVLNNGAPEPSCLQGVATNFGDNDLGQPGFSNGSELNAMHISYSEGAIVIFVSGNLEANFNKAEFFIDARPGGQNQLLSNNPDVDFEGLRRMGNSNENATDGLIFDEGFEPDIWIGLTGGDDGNGVYTTFGNFAELRTQGNGTGFYLGSGSSGAEGVINGENGIQIAIDNSNVEGVGSGTGQDCGEDVTTGIEIVIPNFVVDWDFEGLPFDDIKVCAFINGSGHDFVSNQVLGSIPPGDNLGDPRGLNFNLIEGDQFGVMGVVATECPEFAIGACCIGTNCFISSGENCEAGGGIYNGDGSSCDSDPCAIPECPTDINEDGITNVDDLLELLGKFGEICI